MSILYSFQQVVTANAATANVAKIKMNDFYSAKENSKVAIYQERIDNLFAM